MGTLFNQSEKRPFVSLDEQVRHTVFILKKAREELQDQNFDAEVSNCVEVVRLALKHQQLNADYDKQNAFDEQMAGLGELLRDAVERYTRDLT